MEVSLHIRSAAETGATLREALTWERSEKLRSYLDTVASQLESLPVSRICFGTEFCENLLPEPSVLSAVRTACERPFTFLTPYTGDRGLARIQSLLPLLRENDEVVFNDWGVLNVLHREYPYLRPVQGRLLNKSLRDPRVMGLYSESRPGPTLTVLQGSNLDNRAYIAMLARFGVRMAELDALPQGNDFQTAGICLSVYLPFGFISTARVCQAAGLGFTKASKFQPAAPCRHECQSFLLEHTYTNSPFDNRAERFWLMGNTYFFTQPLEMINTLLHAAADGTVSRLNVQPRVPMVYQ